MNAKNWSTRLMNIFVVVALVMLALPGSADGSMSARTDSVVVPKHSSVEAPSASPVTQIVAGGTHTCALTPEGGVVCWGANSSGQLGDGTPIVEGNPVPVVGTHLRSGVMSLSLAWGRTCALTALGRVYCWGGYSAAAPEIVNGLGNQVVQLAVGEFHTCALTSAGKVMCWGYNIEGGLGNGTYTDSDTPVVAIESGAKQITVYGYSSCAAMTTGEVKCWGDGRRGQLGDGKSDPENGHNSNVPVNVLTLDNTPLKGASQVSLGLTHGCAVVGNGVDCWGTNRFGQLGIGAVYAGSRPLAASVLNAAGGEALSGVDRVETGEAFACAHLTSGRIKCWGQNFVGQVGNGTTANAASIPVTVLNESGTAPLEGAVRVTTGNNHACAFTSWEADHPFTCWGHDAMGQLGAGAITGYQSLPRPVSDISGLQVGGTSAVKQIVAGGAHTCSFTTGDGLKCWGSNINGQLGSGATTNSQVPLNVAGLGSNVTGFALGQNFTCAIISWGRVKCWGENTHGQLGNGAKADQSTPVMTILPAVTVHQIAAGDGHACALTLAGSVLCWGDNTYGQLGDGGTTESAVPVTAVASSAVWIAAGGATSCAVLSSGGVKCWGLGDQGQLSDGGSGANYHQALPVDAKLAGGSLLADASQVALGATFGCALLADGTVDCWGSNTIGQLGQGAITSLSAYALPVVTAVGGSPLKGATQITTGGAHACARLYTNRLKCWGQGLNGQIGDGSIGAGAYSALPHPVLDHYEPYAQSTPYLEGVVQVSAGGTHTCAFLSWSDPLPYRCWGGNASGQLGDGEVNIATLAYSLGATDKPYPNPVQNILAFGSSPLTKIVSSERFSCALTQAGGVKCWGNNWAGALGNGNNTDSATPVDVVGLQSGVVGLSAGLNHVCVLTSAGGVKCWGSNSYAQLGYSATGDSNVPVNVIGLPSAIGLEAGGAHTCAILTGGGVQCWGLGADGQLGNGSTNSSALPVSVSGLTQGVIGLSAGANHTCALTTTGGVKCWGSDTSGQLGDGREGAGVFSSVPVDVYGASGGITSVVSGGVFSCALNAAGGVKCWGGIEDQVDLSGLSSGVTSLAAGWLHACAIIAGGAVKCWGNNEYHQLGNGSDVYGSTPVDVTGLSSGILSVSAGTYHTCAVLAGAAPLRCWGHNGSGQFGDGTTISSSVPVESKWLTADGMVEDNKTEVILPTIPDTTIVIPAQPVDEPTVVTVTEVTTPPAPCTGCAVPGDVVIDWDDQKPPIHSFRSYFTTNYTDLLPNTANNSLQDNSAFNENTLNLYKYVDGAWVPMLPCTGCSLDTTNHVLTAVLDGSGVYAMMARTQWDVYLPLTVR